MPTDQAKYLATQLRKQWKKQERRGLDKANFVSVRFRLAASVSVPILRTRLL